MKRKTACRNPPPALLNSVDVPVRLFLLHESYPAGVFEPLPDYSILRECPARRVVFLEGQVTLFGREEE